MELNLVYMEQNSRKPINFQILKVLTFEQILSGMKVLGWKYCNVDFIRIAASEDSLGQQFWQVGVLANIKFI